MEKITKYLSAVLASFAVLVSCDINKPDIFDDANAFVAFDKDAFSVPENYSDDGATLKIPVTLASVAGIKEDVTFKVVDAPGTYVSLSGDDITAKEGVNFEIAGSSNVLSFDAENRTRYIEIRIIAFDGYTGDLKFRIEFDDTKSVNQGAENSCVITIEDLDHPLSALLGTYTVSGEDYWDGPSQWTATISKDQNDVSKVWILNLPNLGGGFEGVIDYYGIVDAAMTTITIPFGQVTPSYKYSGNDITLYGVDDELNDYDTGSIIVTIEKDSAGNVTGLDFGTDFGFWCYIENLGANLGIVLPGITAVKN